jgi:ribosomal protein S18 acetylase RimI-like enzyme
MREDTKIAIFSADEVERRIRAFAVLLHAVVHAGANINFILPFSEEDAEAFFRKKTLPAMREAGRVLWVAEAADRIIGSVQLVTDMPPNQPHRAEVTKLLVHPDFRRGGIGKALMRELETRARALGRTLITLDTRTGDFAELLYTSIGYKTAGIIPDFCLDPFEPKLYPATFMYKAI